MQCMRIRWKVDVQLNRKDAEKYVWIKKKKECIKIRWKIDVQIYRKVKCIVIRCRKISMNKKKSAWKLDESGCTDI